ncbi:hypothetical protein Bhyg_13407 [Pseudolycoriella hygida]|uniref:Uncharacterized protein n=1 Tax=Pseudolycoriella hygida TaxID=35572 RepID=A0A9Q0RWC2_9DIPT|nr:hypothetical protein Bhyg_13407 [Pseudolycoriella hygida]
MVASNSLNFGVVNRRSRLIFEEYFNHTGYADKVALRHEIIHTDDAINAIRATDVSGQNGIASITALSNNFVQLAFFSDGIGRGFDFRVEIYSNVKSIETPTNPKNIWNCWSCCE